MGLLAQEIREKIGWHIHQDAKEKFLFLLCSLLDWVKIDNRFVLHGSSI